MSRGPSGRVVIELDPELKRQLYRELARRDLTLKAWFESKAERLVRTGGQMQLFYDSAESQPSDAVPFDSLEAGDQS